MNATRKVKLKDITANLTCRLCEGYFIEATTIIECLHSFCKSCIVKHLEKSEYCPVCDVQLHSTKPLCSIRSDQMLQEIVYKLVPGLFRKEMSLRREFYESHPEFTAISQMDAGQVFNELYITSDDIIHLSLEYFTDDPKFQDNTTRYLKCPAAVSISILKKLVQGKFDLSSNVEIDVMYGERILPDEFLLMDIAYKYSWTNNGNKPLQLSYRVKGLSPPIGSNHNSNKLPTLPSTKTPASQIKGRRSRASADSDVTRSEILKSSNRNLSIDADTKAQISAVTPKLTPNGKVRGRRKRCLTDDGGKTPVENKRKKSGKNTPAKDSKEMESQSESPISKSMETGNNTEKEVQLRISENGVISAKSILSGEEKIILGSLLKSPSKTHGPSTPSADKSELSNGFSMNKNNEKTTNSSDDLPKANGIPLSQPNTILKHPLLINNSIGKPNYVKLHIPVVPATSHSPTSSSSQKQLTNGNINGSPTAKTPASSPQKLTPMKRKLQDKAVNGNGSTGTVANHTEFEDKQANVKKALIDLEKKLYTTISKGSLSKLPGMLGINNRPTQDEPLVHNTVGTNGTNGSHSIQPSQSQLNGGHLQNAFPFPLSFGSSGMTVNLIASTTSCSSAMGSITSPISSSPPQKKFAHHTTVVNGDLKFTTGPRHILPSPSNETKPPGSVALSPKKPPKFFKSRHSSTSLSGTPNLPDSETQVKKESGTKNVNEILNKHFNFGQTPTVMNSSPCSIGGANTITTPSGMGSSHLQNQASRLQSQVTNSFDPMNLQLNQLQMSLMAASSGSNMPMTLVPFVTSNYCSMPFMNSRSPFSMNTNLSSHLPSFPFNFPGMSSPAFTQSQPYSSGIVNGAMNGGHHLPAPISLKVPNSTADDGKNNGNHFLDLSMNKTNGKCRSSSNGPPQEEPLSLKKSISPKTPSPSTNSKIGGSEKGSKIEKVISKMNGPLSLVTKGKTSPGLDERNGSKLIIVESPSNDMGANDGSANLKETKTSSNAKINIDADIQPKQPVTSSNNDKGEGDSTKEVSSPVKSQDKMPKKLHNGHPDNSSSDVLSSQSSACQERPSELVDSSLKANGNVCKLFKKGGDEKITEEKMEVDPPLIYNSVVPENGNISKNPIIPSCNNNNSPPEISQTSSTTGA